MALRAGTVLNHRYIVGRVLGQGGFGITYLAWDTKLEARVAVKEFMSGDLATGVGGTTVSVLAESKTEAFTYYGAERFQEEARTLAKFMGQPNIAGVTDYFDENDTSYFVMDYIEGISFKTYITNHGGKVSVEDACNVMIPVLHRRQVQTPGCHFEGGLCPKGAVHPPQPPGPLHGCVLLRCLLLRRHHRIPSAAEFLETIESQRVVEVPGAVPEVSAVPENKKLPCS